ncbi:hypothetical protein NLJ89_g10229 [Agrocybe chaxingu]|uniref:Small ribosomal subunit protein uS7 domain-containing protein n=2 Tax=Agaricineae TaxID=2982305 RepID=A0A9W8JYJ9_9AGAR|nr:hypothetical protein NLJ89_g10229 [Agrocybe chaxingu]
MATTLPKDISRLGQEVKLFGKWDTQDVEVKDISLTDYIQVRHAVYLPHTAGRYAKKQFKKAQMPIVERLVDSLMMKGRNNGKKLLAVRIVAHAFEIIHLLTDQNPIQVLVDAIVNTGPREDSTRIGSQGTVRRQAVDVSPLRRVNQSIALLTTGTRESAFRNVKSIAECLADELINAAKGSSNSYAIKKKDELERVAKSNRPSRKEDLEEMHYQWMQHKAPLRVEALSSEVSLQFASSGQAHAAQLTSDVAVDAVPHLMLDSHWHTASDSGFAMPGATGRRNGVLDASLVQACTIRSG